ncbi:mandelate racemase/muconate lactonizing enzyme family protein [Pseudomonadales bacterium]|nr:mandelate racemase/muconate lactonizing enzyme family protein [Pseudomonadales bacterium]MDB4150948.1 mandelate racemase/muconate lactonizing enzyme family protein [Pseudomonadales bacterium]MDB9868187.1 mandelate racemase/muconate lactonizing enzyme family protein [Pseudomonadales bacterium]MDB9879638.1 mandelate racemase/muconate lactonizing enzyme family protein [Pseudomonadales bacterium]MDB9916909.1 mandelate racemase/muconate lactonizing enzyme family protein [Pseudomonadales bacterium
MIIQDIKTWVVGNPPPQTGGRYFIFVKLVTDGGVVGYGEAYSATFDPHLTAKLIEDVAARYLIGRDPHDIETFFRNCYSSGFSQRPDISMMGCVSALEIACWDIIGKEAGQPVYKLLGGRVHETLRTYTYLYPQSGSVYPDEADAINSRNVYNDPAMAAAAASACVEQGFDAVKFDPAGPYTIFDGHMPRLADIERATAICSAVRDAVGHRADILFGTHGQFTAAGARRMARAIEAFDPLWFEEPVPPDMPEVMAEVARSTSIPIATGERLTTRSEFARVIALRAAAILQPNTGRSGGILETKKIAAHAETYQIQIAPHCYCGPIVGAANIQVAATLPNFLILESIKTWDGFHAELLTRKIGWQDGHVIISTEPGLGVELNETVCDANPWQGSQLHLESTNTALV